MSWKPIRSRELNPHLYEREERQEREWREQRDWNERDGKQVRCGICDLEFRQGEMREHLLAAHRAELKAYAYRYGRSIFSFSPAHCYQISRTIGRGGA